MNTIKKVVVLVVLAAIITFVVLSYIGTTRNDQAIDKLGETWTKKITKNESGIDANTVLVGANTVLVGKNTELISANAIAIENINESVHNNSQSISRNHTLIEQNKNAISENTQRIETLSEAHKELANIVYAHGRKINRVVWELVFKIAYGDTEKARVTWNQYCGCTNLPLWEEAVSKLSEIEAEKLLKINEIENETQNTKYQISRIKQKCFQR